jgi:hypothetical protein
MRDPIYWTCSRETTATAPVTLEHRRLDVTTGGDEVSRRMFRVWREMSARRQARERIMVRIWVGRREMFAWEANDLTYPRPAAYYLRGLRAARRREVV